jgi:hypothetical protein
VPADTFLDFSQPDGKIILGEGEEAEGANSEQQIIRLGDGQDGDEQQHHWPSQVVVGGDIDADYVQEHFKGNEEVLNVEQVGDDDKAAADSDSKCDDDMKQRTGGGGALSDDESAFVSSDSARAQEHDSPPDTPGGLKGIVS